MLITQSNLPEAIKQALIYDHGEMATVEELAAKSDSELSGRSANVGRKTINILREYAKTI